jgi:hypothetical protein
MILKSLIVVSCPKRYVYIETYYGITLNFESFYTFCNIYIPEFCSVFKERLNFCVPGNIFRLPYVMLTVPENIQNPQSERNIKTLLT